MPRTSSTVRIFAKRASEGGKRTTVSRLTSTPSAIKLNKIRLSQRPRRRWSGSAAPQYVKRSSIGPNAFLIILLLRAGRGAGIGERVGIPEPVYLRANAD